MHQQKHLPHQHSYSRAVRLGTNGRKGYNLLHINALYDLNKHQQPVDFSEITKALVIADRGYESFNSMVHIQEKGWFFPDSC